jgi:hypothetical protein
MSKMRKENLAYWLSTSFVAFVMTASGSLAILHVPRFMEALKHLGYPSYFADLLGIGKLTGVAVLLAPGLGRWKEWAYSAFGVTIFSACYSHLRSGDGWLAMEPLATFAALVISYLCRSADRRAELPGRAKIAAQSF